MRRSIGTGRLDSLRGSPRCLLLLLPFVLLGGCATDLTRRDAIGNPQVARMSAEELARATPSPAPVPTREDIVQMSRRGVPAAQIIERIKAGGGRYPLTPEELEGLRARGVDQAVLDHLAAAERAAQITDHADREARAEQERAYTYGYRGPYYRDYYRYSPWVVAPYLGYGFGPRWSGWHGGIRVW